MFQHYFKLVWARRKQYFLIMTTLFLAFLSIAFFGSITIKRLFYMMRSTGYSHQNVYNNSFQSKAQRAINYNSGDPYQSSDSLPSEDEKRAAFLQIAAQLELEKEITKISITPGHAPFNFNMGSWRFINYEEQELHIRSYFFDDHYAEVIGMPVVEGRWFSNEDDGANIPSIIVTGEVAEEFFPDQSPIGEIISMKEKDKSEKEYRIIGVVETYRQTIDQLPTPSVFQRYRPAEASTRPPREILAAYREGTEVIDIDEKIERLTESTPITGGWWYREGRSLVEQRKNNLGNYLVPIIIALAVAVILLSNVAIGIFGVFWQNVLRRTSELGIRRAMGSTKFGIRWLVVGESMAIASIAVGLGTLLFIQLPISGYAGFTFEDTFTGIGFSTIFIYALVLVCSLYPAFLAGKIQPAIALMEE